MILTQIRIAVGLSIGYCASLFDLKSEFCYYLVMSKLNGKIIVITGGTSGIGRHMAGEFCKNNTIVNLARSCGEETGGIRCDVSSEADVKAAFDIVRERYGRVDILINNAGYGVSGAAELLSDKEVNRIFDVNFMGVFRCVKYALPLMSAGGKIVNISSACAIFPLPFRSMYCASKAAVSMFSHSLREEVRPYGIDVTAICPGDIRTEFTKNRVKNFTTNDRYGDRIKAADDHISAREHKRMSVDYACGKIEKIIAKKRYRPFYIVGGKYRFLYALYRIFPLGVILKATGDMFAPVKKDKPAKNGGRR